MASGVYWLYWHLANPQALVMRSANFSASSCLYWLCGFVWLHLGTLRTLLDKSVDNPRSG